jgi:hypothetical protein
MNRFTKLLTATVLALPVAAGIAFSAQADTVAFVLRNNSGTTLSRFFASPSYLDNWESDVLGSSVLNSGYQLRVTFYDGRSTCYYDFLSVFSDGTKITRRNVNVCDLGVYTIN